MRKSHEEYLQIAINLSYKSRESGNTPFAAILVDKEGNVWLEQMNVEITEHKCTGHAETQVVVHSIQLLNLALCVPVPSIGQISATLFTL